MHSRLLASFGFALLLVASSAAFAADHGCCGDKNQVVQAADKGCCEVKAEAVPVAAVADKGCCGDKTQAAPANHAAHAVDKVDKTHASPVAHSCDMPCCKAPVAKASMDLMADSFLLTFDTEPPVPPAPAAGRGTPTIR